MTVDEVVPGFLAVCPGVTPRWERHLEFWEDEPVRGHYNDISVVAHHLVDRFAAGDTSEFPGVFELVERCLAESDEQVQELIVVGLLEGIQNTASHQAFGMAVFEPWLGPRSRAAWEDLCAFWGDATASNASSPRRRRDGKDTPAFAGRRVARRAWYSMMRQRVPKGTSMSSTNDPYDLHRFTEAQEGVYAQALSEIRGGLKVSHWMWYIFPQIEGLGFSTMSKRYAIRSLAEARAYLEHPVLGPRLRECAEAALQVEGRSARDIFGATDEQKLRSSATLFAQASPEGSVFHRLLDRYFQGRPDRRTLELLGGGRV